MRIATLKPVRRYETAEERLAVALRALWEISRDSAPHPKSVVYSTSHLQASIDNKRAIATKALEKCGGTS
jgi:hypothetical protein